VHIARPALLVALVTLAPATAAAQFRYMGVVDVREVYNSDVLDLEASADTDTTNPDLITEVEPGLRFYLGGPRSLLSVRYGFRGQIYTWTADPDRGGPLLGYGNDLSLMLGYLLSERTEFGISSQTSQGTENITQQAAAQGSGAVQPVAPRLAVGSRYVTETLSIGVMHLLTEEWSIRPLLTGFLYWPYGQPPSELRPDEAGTTPNPVYGGTFANQVVWNYATGSLLLGFETSLTSDRLDDAHKLNLGIQKKEWLHLFHDDWLTLIVSTTVGWRWQITPFLDTLLGAGFAYNRMDRYDSEERVVNPSNTPAPLGEAVIRFRRGRNLVASLNYAHGWTRQPELGQASTAETDTVGLYGFYGLQNWTFETIASFLYLRLASHTDQPTGIDASKGFTGEAVASYLIYPGFSASASYRYDTLFGAITATGEPPPADVDRHLITIGISVAWPPPPPQDVRLTRRESEHEPMFLLGQNAVGGGDPRQQQRGLSFRPEQQNRAVPPWQQGTVRPERRPEGTSLLPPEPDEEPPTAGQRREEEDDSAYYSWPR